MRRFRHYPPGKRFSLLWIFIISHIMVTAQVTFPVNGVADPKVECYAFTNATIVKDAQNTIEKATLVIRKGKITDVGTSVTVPKDAVIIDCSGKYIYPSFIDIYTDYGIPATQRQAGGFNFNAPSQLTSNKKGAFGWNQAIKADVEAGAVFSVDDAKAKPLRDIGFGTVLTHQQDGIARGTGAVVTLANEADNLAMVKDKAASY